MISFGPTEEQAIVREAMREFSGEVLRGAARDADEASALPDAKPTVLPRSAWTRSASVSKAG